MKKPEAGDLTVESQHESSNEAKSKALLFVCGHADSVREAQDFIDMLGLRQVLKDSYLGADK